MKKKHLTVATPAFDEEVMPGFRSPTPLGHRTLHATRRTGATNHLGPRVQNGNIRHEIPSQECAPST